MSDPAGRGFLDKQGLFIALKLVALAQNGKDLNVGALTTVAPAPRITALGPSAGGGSRRVRLLSPQSLHSPVFRHFQSTNSSCRAPCLNPRGSSEWSIGSSTTRRSSAQGLTPPVRLAASRLKRYGYVFFNRALEYTSIDFLNS